MVRVGKSITIKRPPEAIDPTMVITHRLPLSDAAKGYEIFLNKEDRCEKVVLSPR